MTKDTTCTLAVSTEIVRHPPQTHFRVRSLFGDFRGDVHVDFPPRQITVTLSRPPTDGELRRLVTGARRKLRAQNPTDGQILLALLSSAGLSSPDLSYAFGREQFLRAEYEGAVRSFRDAATNAQGLLRTAATALLAIALIHQGGEQDARDLLATSGVTFYRSKSHLAGELIDIWRRDRGPAAADWQDLIHLLNLAHLCEMSGDEIGAASLYGQVIWKHHTGVAEYVRQAALEDYELMIHRPNSPIHVTCHPETGQLLLRKAWPAAAAPAQAIGGAA